MKRPLLVLAALTFLSAGPAAAVPAKKEVSALFEPDARNQLVMTIEAAIARAQAAEGIVPREAAEEITAKADVSLVTAEDLAAEYDIVRHRMVALLNVWKRSLSADARDAVHFGVTTVDIYDTVRLLQVRETIGILLGRMQEVEDELLRLAQEHAETVMIGRTLGQHALPITFGKKAAVWAAANRRNMDRLRQVDARLAEMGVLRGAVGTHLGLGQKGIAVEKRVARELGLETPDPADWHGMRDVFAEYALTLALASRTYAAMGDEIFRLQMTDIAEVVERRPGTAVGSSTMPHKRNPSRSEALIHHGRVIPRLAEVLLDDVVNAFERDNTSRPNRVLEDISLEAAVMVDDALTLLTRLDIDTDRMRANLDRTGGMVMAQRIVLDLEGAIGREAAEEGVRRAAHRAIDDGASFAEALLADPELAPHLDGGLDDLLDPETYTGLSAEQAKRTVSHLKRTRSKN